MYLPQSAVGWSVIVTVPVLAVLHADNANAHSKKPDISKYPYTRWSVGKIFATILLHL